MLRLVRKLQIGNILLAIGLCLFPLRSHGVILARTGDSMENRTPPDNDVAGSGWNYQGDWGSYSGTPIAPQYFLSASHIGQAGGVFVYRGVTYTIAASFQDPFSDLLMWKINETFPEGSYAPLYTKNDEAGQRIVAIGRGTQRGDPYDLNNTFRGWRWGAGDEVRRWGENVVTTTVTFGVGNNFLYALFDNPGLPNECHLSAGDSGGAVFINDGGVCKLAGINYGVDGHFYTDNQGHGEFDAALFDAGGLYEFDDSHNTYVLLDEPTPTGFYATRISAKVPWIESVIDPNGITNADGIPNLLEYAKVLNAVAPAVYGGPVFARESSSSVSLTYRKINNPSLQYQLQQSNDLVGWGPASSQDTAIVVKGNVSTIKSVVATTPNTPVFLRLLVTQP